MLKNIFSLIIALILFGSTAYSQGKIAVVPMYEGSKIQAAIDHYNEGATHGASGDMKSAKKSYLKAIKADPNYVEAYDNVGLIYRLMGDYPKAIEYYQKSIKIFPEGHLAHQNLAVVYVKMKDYRGAIREYEKLIKLSTENAEGYFGLANAYMLNKKYDHALRNAELALSLYKAQKSDYVGDGYNMIGIIHYYNKKMDLAKKNFKLAKAAGYKIHPQIEREFFSESTPSYKLDKAEDYAAYEDKVISDFKWLQDTPKGTDPAKRKEISRFIILWVTGAPKVSVEISEKIVTFLECADCLTMFLGGWTVYALTTKKYDDKFGGTKAGVEAVVKYYSDNKANLEKNEGVEKYVELKANGELDAYIKKQIE